MTVAWNDTVDVLLIEGDPDLAALYRYKLELDDYRVTLAKPAYDELHFGATNRPDLIFIELSPASTRSFAVFKALTRNPGLHAIPRIVLTQATAEELRAYGIELAKFDSVIHLPRTFARSMATTEVERHLVA